MAKKTRKKPKNRLNLPNFSPQGVILCKKTIKSGNSAEYWAFPSADALENIEDMYTNYPNHLIFTKGKSYIYMKDVLKESLLIKSNGGLWFPFDLNRFNEIFRFFT